MSYSSKMHAFYSLSCWAVANSQNGKTVMLRPCAFEVRAYMTTRAPVHSLWSTSFSTERSNPLLAAIFLTFCTNASSRCCRRVKIHRPAPLIPSPVRHPPEAELEGGPPEMSTYPSDSL